MTPSSRSTTTSLLRPYVAFYDALITAGLPPVPPVDPPVEPPVPTPAAPVRHITVMTGRVSKTRVDRHRSAVMTGTVGPDYAGRIVRIQRRHGAHGAWHTIWATAPLTKRTYRIKVPTGKRGRWKFRTVTAATRSATLVTTAAISPTRTVRVVR